MVHHGLLFRYISEAVWRNVCHLTDCDGFDEEGEEEEVEEMYGTSLWGLHANKLVEKWWEGSYKVKKLRS